jgi:hypothetical protein
MRWGARFRGSLRLGVIATARCWPHHETGRPDRVDRRGRSRFCRRPTKHGRLRRRPRRHRDRQVLDRDDQRACPTSRCRRVDWAGDTRRGDILPRVLPTPLQWVRTAIANLSSSGCPYRLHGWIPLVVDGTSAPAAQEFSSAGSPRRRGSDRHSSRAPSAPKFMGSGALRFACPPPASRELRLCFVFPGITEKPSQRGAAPQDGER